MHKHMYICVHRDTYKVWGLENSHGSSKMMFQMVLSKFFYNLPGKILQVK